MAIDDKRLDLGRFESWATGDANKLVEIVGIFRNTMSESLKRALDAAEARNGRELKRAAHDLKNCFLLVGAREASVCAEQIEELVSLGSLDDALVLVPRVQSEAVLVDDAVAGLGQV
jgi:HPt (histidine-containing phosphotransfer) domain-containing protein